MTTVEPVPPNLVPLEMPCPDCPTFEQRDANAAEWAAWHEREQTAYETFVAGYKPPFGAYGAWTSTDTYQELEQAKPERLDDLGCFECSGTGLVLTEQGKVLLDFVKRYAK